MQYVSFKHELIGCLPGHLSLSELLSKQPQNIQSRRLTEIKFN